MQRWKVSSLNLSYQTLLGHLSTEVTGRCMSWNRIRKSLGELTSKWECWWLSPPGLSFHCLFIITGSLPTHTSLFWELLEQSLCHSWLCTCTQYEINNEFLFSGMVLVRCMLQLRPIYFLSSNIPTSHQHKGQPSLVRPWRRVVWHMHST